MFVGSICNIVDIVKKWQEVDDGYEHNFISYIIYFSCALLPKHATCLATLVDG